MKVKTLIILSVLFFVLGSLGGAAYAFVSGDSILTPVAGILPTPKSPEEKLIDDFIEQQEKKKQTDGQQTEGAQTADENDKPEGGQTADKPTDKTKDQAKDQPAQSTDKEDGDKRLGQPTVSDGTTLRVRATPDAKNGKVLLGIPNTEKVEIIDEKNGWYQIITANGTKGWVSAEYMKEL